MDGTWGGHLPPVSDDPGCGAGEGAECLPSSVTVQGSIQSSVGPQDMSLSTAVRRSVLICSLSVPQCPSAAIAIPDGHLTFL